MSIKRQSCITIFSLLSVCIVQFLSAQELYFNNFEDKDDISFWGCGYPAFFGSSKKAEEQGLMSIGHKGLFSTFEGGKANSGVRAFKLDMTLPRQVKNCSWNYWSGPVRKIPLDKPVYLSGYIYAEKLPPDVEVGLGWSVSGISKDGKRVQSNRKITDPLKTANGWMFFQADIKKRIGTRLERHSRL